MAEHSPLGASGAYRWWACPGSVKLSEALPPEPSSVYAIEGTAAHALGEKALLAGQPPSVFVGDEFDGVRATDEMADAVAVYVDHVGDVAQGNTLMVEKRITLASLGGVGSMLWGTADAIVYAAEDRCLHVVDYKHGQGVAVDVDGNKQLMYYALGALVALGPGRPVRKIIGTIVQPRAPHPQGPVRSATWSLAELLDWSTELLAAAERTQQPKPPLAAGDHCRFCRAKTVCPELRRHLLDKAKAAFKEDGKMELPNIEDLDETQVFEMLAYADDFIAFGKALKDHAHRKLEAGYEHPDWKLVQKRAMRKWSDEDQVRKYLTIDCGLDPEDFEVSKLATPAQIDKLLTKTEKATLRERNLVVSESSGTTLAPASDKRPAFKVNTREAFGSPEV